MLPDAVVEALRLTGGETVLDATLGRGGHAALLIPRLGRTPGGRYIGLDTDPENAAYARGRLTPIAEAAGVRLEVHHLNFDQLPHWSIQADAVLADLGFASNQIAEPGRGLSFKQEGPLDMRLDPAGSRPTAEDLIRDLPQDELADLIYRYGEERLSRRIARKIVAARAREPITDTASLARIVRAAYPPPGGPGRRAGRNRDPKHKRRTSRGHRIDPATRTFQALRIAVNGELDALNTLLGCIPGLLRVGGRAALISFHSLEDRPIKRRFQQLEQAGHGTRVNRKPVTAGGPEQAANPRSRSAKLRVFLHDPQPDAASQPPPPLAHPPPS